jgi:hypothetical protein
MNRRKFIRNTALAAGAGVALPYILPSGRLFATSNVPLAKHVIYVLFAGGVRQQESVLQRYLDDSQGLPFAGNIMYNMLNGAAPTNKIVYGVEQGGGAEGGTPIPQILGQTLQQQGTLFSEVRSSTAAHYNGLNLLLQGSQVYTQGLRQKPSNPTIFEYIRRHAGIPASKVWFVGNGIGNSVPLLNYSMHPDYGVKYGANFFAPNITFGNKGFEHLSNAKIYHPENELDPIAQMKFFLDNTFENYQKTALSIGNTEDEMQEIQQFMKLMYEKVAQNAIAFPTVTDGNDTRTIGFTCEVIKHFKPTLTVVNLGDVDGCHSNFTGYLRSLHRADHAVGHLWNYVKSQIPEMANDTIIICSPECGRNLNHNPIKDNNNFFAYDHSDENSLRVFTLMAGPNVPQNLIIGSEASPKGLIADGVPTIAEILGVKADVVNAGLITPDARSLFDRI